MMMVPMMPMMVPTIGRTPVRVRNMRTHFLSGGLLQVGLRAKRNRRTAD
jgi:hypothetical protein